MTIIGYDTSRPNTRSNVDVAKPPTFSEDISKILGFLVIYRLYIRMKMSNVLVEKKTQ